MEQQNQCAAPPNVDSDVTERPSFWTSVMNLFVAPTKAFQSIKLRPRWLWPFVFASVAVFTQMAVTGNYHMADLKEQIRTDPTLSNEDRQRRIGNIEAQRTDGVSLMRVSEGLVMISLLQLGKLLALSFLFWLVLQVLSSGPGFVSVLSVCSFSFLVLIPEAVIRTPLVVLKKSTQVFLGPAAFLQGVGDENLLFNFLKQLDIFTIWMVCLLIIGLSIVSGISVRRSGIMVSVFWAVWLLINSYTGGLIRVT